MSRSRRKTPIFAVSTCRSERDDKKLWHQLWRSRERSRLAATSPEGLHAYLPLLENDIMDVWSMGKDGRRYCSFKEQGGPREVFCGTQGAHPGEARLAGNARAAQADEQVNG